MASDDRLREALRLLAEFAQERLVRHPGGDALGTSDRHIELPVEVPLLPEEAALDTCAETLSRAVDEAVLDHVHARTFFHPGRVRCLRCASVECEHARPASPREVFAGYGPSGMPRFLDLGELLLERESPRLGELFATGGGIVTELLDESALNERLLPAFRSARGESRVRGAVLAGWYRVPGLAQSEAIALSLLLVHARSRRGRHRWGLNVLGVTPDGAPLEHLHDKMKNLPWDAGVRWLRSGIRTLRAPDAKRVAGLLGGLARRLERGERASGRRTSHAQDRHAGGSRPTRMAIADFEGASVDAIAFDERKRTFVVVGERGRCHVFSPQGKLVTSVRYPAPTIERRRKSGQWRAASSEEVSALRQALRKLAPEHEQGPTQTGSRDPS